MLDIGLGVGWFTAETRTLARAPSGGHGGRHLARVYEVIGASAPSGSLPFVVKTVLTSRLPAYAFPRCVLHRRCHSTAGDATTTPTRIYHKKYDYEPS